MKKILLTVFLLAMASQALAAAVSDFPKWSKDDDISYTRYMRGNKHVYKLVAEKKEIRKTGFMGNPIYESRLDHYNLYRSKKGYKEAPDINDLTDDDFRLWAIKRIWEPKWSGLPEKVGNPNWKTLKMKYSIPKPLKESLP